jgi:hypothetical protein
MKKITVWIALMMLVFSSLAYAGGDQNCGDEGTGPTGTTGEGSVSQNRAPAN